MLDIEEAIQAAKRSTLILSTDRTPRGHTRFETGMIYPDGTSIEVFLPREPDLIEKGGLRLTDFGQTMDWLLNIPVRPWLSKKRQTQLEQAIKLYGVVQSGGELVLPLKSLDEVATGVLRLAQACLRVSDLSFSKRTALQSSFNEDVEAVLSDLDVNYVPEAELEARGGKLIRVDFLVKRQHLPPAAILTMSNGNASQAHVLANEVFSRFYDLRTFKRPEDRVTIWNDGQNVYREVDLNRLGDVSTVVPISDTQTLGALLAG